MSRVKKLYIILLLIRRLGNVVMVIATWLKLGTAASSLNLPCHCGTSYAAIVGITSTGQTWLSASTFHVSFDVT